MIEDGTCFVLNCFCSSTYDVQLVRDGANVVMLLENVQLVRLLTFEGYKVAVSVVSSYVFNLSKYA